MPKSQSVTSPEEIRVERKQKEQKLELTGRAEMSKLSEKRRRLAEQLLLNPTQSFTDAYKKAGYKLGPNSKASVIKREISGKLSATLREAGIFESDLAKVLIESLNAMAYKMIKVPVYHDNGKLKTFRHDVVEVPDMTTRLAAFKQACMLGDYFPATKLDINQRTETSTRIFGQVDINILEDRAKQLRDQKVEVPATYEVEDVVPAANKI